MLKQTALELQLAKKDGELEAAKKEIELKQKELENRDLKDQLAVALSSKRATAMQSSNPVDDTTSSIKAAAMEEDEAARENNKLERMRMHSLQSKLLVENTAQHHVRTAVDHLLRVPSLSPAHSCGMTRAGL